MLVATAAVAALALPAPHIPTAIAAAPPVPVHVASAIAAAATWVSTHRVQAIASVVLAIPALALFEAGYFVLQFRSKHGEAPCPIVPSHGVVTVGGSSVDGAFYSVSSTAAFPETVQSGSRRFDKVESWATVGDNATERMGAAAPSALLSGGGPTLPLEKADGNSAGAEGTDPPLRLLVVGDSLAAGIGTSQSCTPVLPQSIATCLSRDLGRPVQWTCLGEPGASAGWIARTLESFRDGREGDRSISGADTTPPDVQAEEGDDIDNDLGKKHWDDWLRERLNLLGHRLLDTESDDVGRYDVAVVLTGSNDLKFSVLPFMFKEQKREESVRGGDFAAELKGAIDAVADKMKVGIRESLERVRYTVEESFDSIRTSVEEVLPSEVLERINWANMTGGGLDGEEIVSAQQQDRRQVPLEQKAAAETDASSPRTVETEEEAAPKWEGRRPLVILPALPARNLPVSRWIPLRWIALPLLGIIERAKKALAELYPGAIVFVDAPERPDFEQFERRTGPVWEKWQAEKGVVSLTDVAMDDCERVTRQMREYYTVDSAAATAENKGEGDFGTDANANAAALEGSAGKSSSSRRRNFGAKLGRRKRRGSPSPRGEAFLAPDMIHPNDRGYNFWGRYIAEAIVAEWDDDYR